MAKLFNEVVCYGFPKAWTLNTIAPIHKARDPMDPGNYMTIMIGHVMYKIYASVGMTLEEGRGNGFGEDVGDIVGSGAKEEQNGTVKNLLTSVVVLNFDVLLPSMEDRVACNCDAALIVTKKGGRSVLSKTTIEKKAPKPNSLASGTAHGTILGFGGR